MELSSIIALILGIYGSIKFSDFTYSFFLKNFPKLIIVLISIIGKLITKLVKMIFLGFINKIMGGIFGSFKFALLLSLCLVFFESLNTSLNLFDTSILDSSFFYEPIKEVGDKLTSIFNSNKESINFFN
jgi:membrane protein required for colicin V production